MPRTPNPESVSVVLQLGPERSADLRGAAAARGMPVGKLVEQMVLFSMAYLRPVTPDTLFAPPNTVPNERGEPVEVSSHPAAGGGPHAG